MGILKRMAFGVFIHRTDSIYDDVPSEKYQFPKQYLTRVQQCEGDWIVYLEPSKVKDTKGYFAMAKVQEIIVDPRNADMHLAVIEPGSYLDFGDPVPFRDADEIMEQGLLNNDGKISGRAQAAVRCYRQKTLPGSLNEVSERMTTSYRELIKTWRSVVFTKHMSHFNT